MVTMTTFPFGFLTMCRTQPRPLPLAHTHSARPSLQQPLGTRLALHRLSTRTARDPGTCPPRRPGPRDMPTAPPGTQRHAHRAARDPATCPPCRPGPSDMPTVPPGTQRHAHRAARDPATCPPRRPGPRDTLPIEARAAWLAADAASGAGRAAQPLLSLLPETQGQNTFSRRLPLHFPQKHEHSCVASKMSLL
uniref:Uncharacterized protein n=1 Tax=Myotis myotis TaxID=51298 RepID=A0A7J7RCE1_MYOMY|nr:hypothetical protein mMyoMyo1_010833 [Myotis myotis]